jgi:N4-(beta-N-acetylglucosaminyl)-L-asparaginase
VVVASGNGLRATETAMQMVREGKDPLDAVIAGVNIVEADPEDHSVCYGGLPNEDGEVELDSSVMHGPTHKAGAVAALRNIKTPSRVAQLVMQRTDHVLLVGEGALRFARAHGFEEVNLLTDEARRIWLKWKEARDDDDWIPEESVDEDAPSGSAQPAGHVHRSVPSSAGVEFTHGTINCCALDTRGDLAGVTTTSGLSYKIPGRVGDSPIIGAGLYVDNAVGAAGATGRGEAVILNSGAFAVVDLMRQGKTPVDACLEVLRRIIAHNHDPRLRFPNGQPNFDVKFYAVRKDGLYGSAAVYSEAQFAVAQADANRLEDCAYLFERPEVWRREK